MLESLILVLANLPGGLPPDPLFDKPLTATDDTAFVLSVVESGRQAVIDAREGAETLSTPELRSAATRIGRHQRATLARIETIARARGWRVPAGNPERAVTAPDTAAVRRDANFIISQITLHESVLAQFRAQIAGKGDAELRRALREALPAYEQNLELLLRLKL